MRRHGTVKSLKTKIITHYCHLIYETRNNAEKAIQVAFSILEYQHKDKTTGSLSKY